MLMPGLGPIWLRPIPIHTQSSKSGRKSNYRCCLRIDCLLYQEQCLSQTHVSADFILSRRLIRLAYIFLCVNHNPINYVYQYGSVLFCVTESASKNVQQSLKLFIISRIILKVFVCLRRGLLDKVALPKWLHWVKLSAWHLRCGST